MLTGYLPSADAVVAAARAVSLIRSRSPEAIVLCDPILGDDPKGLYIEAAAAEAIRDALLPLADLATPNRFELAYLSARPVQNRTDAARALECLACGGGVATSIPGTHPGYLDNVLWIGPYRDNGCRLAFRSTAWDRGSDGRAAAVGVGSRQRSNPSAALGHGRSRFSAGGERIAGSAVDRRNAGAHHPVALRDVGRMTLSLTRQWAQSKRSHSGCSPKRRARKSIRTRVLAAR